MPRASRSLPLLALLVAPALSGATPPAPDAPKKVVDLIEASDRRLVKELVDYIAANPKADDLASAYQAVFERTIEHDWFTDQEKVARAYLTEYPDGGVRPLAQIVLTMARAQEGKYREASSEFRALTKMLERDDQQEFASSFADSLANMAAVAGEYDVAKDVYAALLDRFGENASLRDKVKDDLARLDMVGKPAPNPPVRDRAGVAFRLSDYKGKYVLVDFWATWCEPCLEELPNVQAAYKQYKDKGFEVVSVSLDETSGPLNEFLKTHEMPWRHVHNATSGGDLVEAFGVNTIPATFLVGPDGKIVRLELRGAALKKALANLIK